MSEVLAKSARPKRKPRGKPFNGADNKGGRPKGIPNKATIEVKQLCRSLIENEEYQRNLKARLYAGELPPNLEAMLWYYGFGKPIESHELSGKNGSPLFPPSLTVVLKDANSDGSAK